MRAFVVKLLKKGVPVAVVSAGLGLGLACLAGPYADAQAALIPGNADVPSERIKVRLPAIMAGMSLAVVATLEGLAALLRGTRAAPAVTPSIAPRADGSFGMDAEVEALLNSILAQTEAERLAQTSPPADSGTCGTGGPRNLSTTH